jgi:hypothetical protein
MISILLFVTLQKYNYTNFIMQNGYPGTQTTTYDPNSNSFLEQVVEYTMVLADGSVAKVNKYNTTLTKPGASYG